MIKSEIQAKSVQKRRFEGNKKGYAKAVVRFFKRTRPKDYTNLLKSLKSMPAS